MFEVYTDGGSRGNPGKSACAFVILKDGKLFHQESIFLGIGTNNNAEYEGLLHAIDFLIQNSIFEARFFSDSELMVKQINKVYKVKDEGIKNLYNRFESKVKNIKKFEISHVRREKNKEADLLVNKCLDEKN